MRPRPLSLCCVALVVLAACSDSGSDSDGPTATTAAAATTDAPTTAEPTATEAPTTTEAPLTIDSLSGRLVIESVSCDAQERERNNNPIGQICMMNIDGTGAVNLSAPGADDGMPTVSPDGKRLAYLSVPDGFNGRIVVMGLDGSNRHFLTNERVYPAPPIWMPDSASILTGTAVLPADGVDLYPSVSTITVPFPEGVKDFLELSHDGKYVSFSSSDVGTTTELECPVVMISDTATGTPTQVLPNPAGGDNYGLCGYFGARWSPDDQWLLFCGEAYDSGQNLWVVHPDGTELTQLTNDLWGGCRAAWSPDGKYIAYTADPDNDGNDSLFVRTLEGLADAQVIEIPAPAGLVHGSNWFDWTE